MARKPKYNKNNYMMERAEQWVDLFLDWLEEEGVQVFVPDPKRGDVYVKDARALEVERFLEEREYEMVDDCFFQDQIEDVLNDLYTTEKALDAKGFAGWKERTEKHFRAWAEMMDGVPPKKVRPKKAAPAKAKPKAEPKKSRYGCGNPVCTQCY